MFSNQSTFVEVYNHGMFAKKGTNRRFHRTSSKEDKNVSELFYMIARDWVSKPAETSSRRGRPFAITGENDERRPCCLST